MGSIYLADDLRLEGRLCALKEVEHDRSLDGDLLEQTREQFCAKQPCWPAWITPICRKYPTFLQITDAITL